MIKKASMPVRALYCLAVLAIALPFGTSGWAALSTGRGVGIRGVPYLLLAIGLWRIYTVIRYPTTLDAFIPHAFAKVLRIVGIIGLAFATIYLAAALFMGPLTRVLMSGNRSGIGVEYYVVGTWLAMLGLAVPYGLVLFELSRLIGFEKQLPPALQPRVMD
ncbi:hypothetical protein BH09PSE6_BH09PSE6_14850 [soil metagenome]